jgi:hypothetical protein
MYRKLVVWPNGDIGNGTRDIYLSLFLELIDCDKYPSTIVTASFKLKILDQLHNKYYDKEGTNIIVYLYFLLFNRHITPRYSPMSLAQLIGHIARKCRDPGSNPGTLTYFTLMNF